MLVKQTSSLFQRYHACYSNKPCNKRTDWPSALCIFQIFGWIQPRWMPHFPKCPAKVKNKKQKRMIFLFLFGRIQTWDLKSDLTWMTLSECSPRQGSPVSWDMLRTAEGSTFSTAAARRNATPRPSSSLSSAFSARSDRASWGRK